MKRLLYFLLSVSIILLVNNVVNGQSRNQIPVEFNKLVHDFGNIGINSGKHSYVFKFKNISDKPVIVHTVVSSCGCTTPEWTKKPIMPGESGEIGVTFLNDQGPYPFDKSLTVYLSGATKPVILRIKGVVFQKPRSLKEIYPAHFGAAALRTSVINIGQIAKGNVKKDVVTIANISSKDIKVSFANSSKGVELVALPSVIKAGEKADLNIAVDSRQIDDWGYVKLNAQLVVDGKLVGGKGISIECNILDNFSSLTAEQRGRSALPMTGYNTHDFGKVKSGTLIEAVFEIKNLGREDLIVHKIDSSDPRVSCTYQKVTKPGSGFKVSVKVDTKGESGDKAYILTMVTNSPSRPLMNLVISGTIY